MMNISGGKLVLTNFWKKKFFLYSEICNRCVFIIVFIISLHSFSHDDFVVKSAYPDTPLPKGNLAEYVLEKGKTSGRLHE